MKHLKHLFTALLLLFSLTATAHEFEVDGVCYNILSGEDKTVEVAYRGTSYNQYSNEYTGSVTIPESVTYNGTTFSVTSIEYGAFYGCSGLTSIVIGNNVTSIGDYAFYGCNGLTSIVIGNNVTSIGDYAFYGCNGLTSIVIGNNVTSIGNYAFSGCSGLTSITIPNSVTSIGNRAFWGCTGLKEVHISDIAAWCSIGFSNAYANPLYYAKNLYLNGELVTEITIPNSVTSIEYGAFYGCSGLTSIVIGNNVTSIGDYAFYGCNGLTSIVIGNNVTSIGDYAFYGCNGLTSIVIGNNVTSIGIYAFYNCTGLKTVINCSNLTFTKGSSNYGYVACYATKVINAPNAVIDGDFIWCKLNGANTLACYLGEVAELTLPADYNGENYVIGNEAFKGCTGLTSITIPNSVTSIGSGAFYNCYGLKKAIWLTNTPPSGYKNVGATYNYVANNEYSGLSNVKVYSYLSSIFEVDGVKYVPVSPAERTCDAIDCAYNDTTSVDIVIGKTVSYKGISMNVKEIMPYALYANEKIKSVKFENEGNIGDYAFTGCTALQTADISNEGNIGDYAFSGCTALQTADISNEGNIGDYAFSGCTALQTADISNEGNIGDYAFSDCTALTTANISNKGSIGSCAFSGCNNLAEATLGDSVTSIGTEAFCNCKALGNIVIPDAVTSIGNKAFSGCSSLKSAEIGAGVTSINEAIFSGCSAMTSITIGDSVKTIGKNAFYGCTSLAEVAIPQSVTKIADYVFDNCSSLADVVIENDSTVLSLGSNGSSPLFADCPLDSVYIGRKINYSTSSNYGYSPFYRNTSLRTVVITDTETEIYDNEFYGCSNLKNVSIGNGVNKIGKWAFSGCSSLDYFAFGDNVQSIGEEAFSDCNNVTRILTSAMTPPVCGNQALDDINKWNCSLYVPSEAKSAYQQAEQWKEFFFVEDLPASIGEVFEDVKGESGNVKAIYDLQGRVVENPASGIYIIDGKKVLVK